jgi:hypothetical protein
MDLYFKIGLRFILLLVLGYSSTGMVYSKDTTTVTKQKLISYFNLGALAYYQQADVGTLNSKLTSFNLPVVTNQYYGYGASVGLTIKSRLVLTGELSRMNPLKVNERNQQVSRINGSRTFFGVGYIVNNRNRIKLVPEIGFGQTNLNITIRDYTVYEDVDTFLLSKQVAGMVSKNSFAQIALGLEFSLSKPNQDFPSQGKIGLKLAYQFTGPNQWTGGNSSLVNGPALPFNGLLLQLNYTCLVRQGIGLRK